MIRDTDQGRLLDEAISCVKQQSFLLRRAIEGDNARDALKCSARIISELRTSALSPRNYNNLYITIFQELQHLYSFLSDPARRGRPIGELYEDVQRAGSILPRLYLLITVGSCYIQSMECPANEVLRDLAELCKGVQNPIRGLFLRNYLTGMCKDKLPDSGSIYESSGGGTVTDAFDFLFSNFTDCTLLWIRLQSQSPGREKQQRELERYDLRVLVGSNLVAIAHLEGMTPEFYANVALPKLLEFILDCRDTLAQQYLFDCLIQAFSDECHIKTLDRLLTAFLSVLPSVDLNSIKISLMDRLRSFVLNDPSAVPEDIVLFQLFRKHMIELIKVPVESATQQQNQPETPTRVPSKTPSNSLEGVLELQVAFLSFTLELYPGNVNYMEAILRSASDLLSSNLVEGEFLSKAGADSIGTLLCNPLKYLPLSILELEHYPKLFSFIDAKRKKKVAMNMLSSVLDASASLSDPNYMKSLFTYLAPIIVEDVDEEEKNTPLEGDALVAQNNLAKLIHMISTQDIDKAFKIYLVAFEALKAGRSRRMNTFPALVFCGLRLVRLMWQKSSEPPADSDIFGGGIETTPKQIFQFTNKVCSSLLSYEPKVTLNLFLQCAALSDIAESMNPGEHKLICYEFLTQALLCYEDEISDSRLQFDALILIIATMSSQINSLDLENYTNIAGKVTVHCSKLLRKAQQSRAVLACTHMFWKDNNLRDSKRVLDCLQKSLKIAGESSGSANFPHEILVEILNKYVYFYEEGNSDILPKYIQNLVTLCIQQNQELEGKNIQFRSYLKNTLNYLNLKQDSELASLISGMSLDESIL